MHNRRGKVRLLVLAALVVVGVVVAILVTREPPPQTNPEPKGSNPLPLPAFSETRFLNTGPDAKFIGSAACAGCHRTNHASYALTAHSRALTDVDPNAEPPDGAFDHKTSGRSYRVYRQDGMLRHEELVKAADGTEIARVDLPVRYVVGSGHYARTYLADVGGFLHESPVTWYASKKRWDMSPGYDFPQHWGFERSTGTTCMGCHAGRVDDGDTVHKLTFLEKAIGCESCHGPGSAHRDLHVARKTDPGADDLTIVHPGKLPRELREDVCSACHLGGPAAVLVRGRKAGDSRPGMSLTDYQVHYRFESGAEQMKVVGHVEQLRQSACYQKSADMTCVTCHDPHRRADPVDSVAYYRGKCLECHTKKGCSSPVAERLKKSPADDCASCHMPRGDTEVPHVAFTHHRIGRHGKPPPPEPDRVPDLVPVGDVSRLSLPDRERNLGLAYSEAARTPTNARFAQVFAARAREHLEAAYAAGLRDGPTVVTLAVLCWTTKEPERATELARAVVGAADTSPDDRAVALILLASYDRQNQDFDSAIVHLESVTRLRRFADDWRLLGVSRLERGDTSGALTALRESLAIRPYRNTTHLALAEAYRRLGDARLSKEHQAKARWLIENRQN